MKSRRKIITAKDPQGVSVEINIVVRDKHNNLSPASVNKLVSRLADAAMQSILDAPHIAVFLHEIKVR